MRWGAAAKQKQARHGILRSLALALLVPAIRDETGCWVMGMRTPEIPSSLAWHVVDHLRLDSVENIDRNAAAFVAAAGQHVPPETRSIDSPNLQCILCSIAYHIPQTHTSQASKAWARRRRGGRPAVAEEEEQQQTEVTARVAAEKVQCAGLSRSIYACAS